jgi:hypothetical protein
MIGIIFIEFLNLVDNTFGENVCELMIERAELPSGGAYTVVGNYPFDEMTSLITELSLETKIPIEELLIIYGEYLFAELVKIYPDSLAKHNCAFDLLTHLDSHIHVEVKKLYPEAELPIFIPNRLNESEMEMDYFSSRGLVDLAEGLIRGSANFFGQEVQIVREGLGNEDGTEVRFHLTKS